MSTLEKPKGPGCLFIYTHADDLLHGLVQDFRAGKPADWPVVPKALLHKVWSRFTDSGVVRDERALERIFNTMTTALGLLLVANIVSGHTAECPVTYLEGYLEETQVEAFCDWLIDDGSGYWRISDYGAGPLVDAMALAYEARTLGARLKYLDRALHVTHMRGDLARLFVEGGRATVAHLDEAKMTAQEEIQYA